MSRLLLFLCLCTLFTSCASLTAYQGLSPNSDTTKTTHFRQGTSLHIFNTGSPQVIVTPEGGHAVVMPPCGNLAVVVNPDGTHSTAMITGNTAIIVTP